MRVIAWAAALASLVGCAADTEPRPLNSERIRARYGDYAVDVRYQSESLRISELYSRATGERHTRTIAIVEFAAVPVPELAAVDATIRAGASLGATLRNAGWEIAKESLWIGTVDPAQTAHRRLRTAMCSSENLPIAAYRYRLRITKSGDQAYTYATVTEFYDPDYLDEQAVRRTSTAPTEPENRSVVTTPLNLLANVTLHRDSVATPCD
ncbi:MAG: hypothetical protein AAGH76_13475 [Pseudomonadota bacterium]